MPYKKVLVNVLIGLTAIVLAYGLRFGVPALASLELKTLDWRFAWRGVQEMNDAPVVLVTIDDYAFELLPERWPWPRDYYAHAVRNLTRAGAAAVGIDVIMDVPDLGAPERDRELAAAVRASERVILARKLEQDVRLSTLWNLVEPAEVLREAAGHRLGLVSIAGDADGIYRHYNAALAYNDTVLTSFALEMLRQYHGYDPGEVPRMEGGRIAFGDYRIPVDPDGSFLINFAGPRGTYPSYSFASLLDDGTRDLGEDTLNAFNNFLLPDSVFKDKIVLIGSTVSELHDNHPTPFLQFGGRSQEMPGVEILANATHTMLSGDYLVSVSGWLQFVLVVALTALVLFICARLSVWRSLVITALVVVAFVALLFGLFSSGQVLEMVVPTMAVAFAYVGTNLYSYLLTQKEKRQILGAFQHYVPPKVVKELIEHPEKLSLGGEERVMSVLFSDIASFTTISESLTPRQLVSLINEYLSEMTDIILRYDGIIDKYEGDAIMAEFGAPVFYEDHAVKACHAALEMQARLREMARDARKDGKPVLTSRVGINTGNMIVGNMGSRQVFDYTVLGDEVNLASRLEGANKAYGSSIMISEATLKIVKSDFVTRPLDAIRVKGKNRPVLVFELLARKSDRLDPALTALLPIYREGVQLYQSRQWEAAAHRFRHCLRLRPGDGPSKVYLRRVVEFAKTPPPPDWDGVFEMTSK